MDVQSICSVLPTSLGTLHIFRPMSFSTSNTECHCEVLENVSAELQTFMFEVYDVGLVNTKHAYAGNIPQLPLQYIYTSTKATRTLNLY